VHRRKKLIQDVTLTDLDAAHGPREGRISWGEL
jgi:DNA helicase TIP49 (TBP-interacting protein)